jgi:hypothetical protein
MAPIECSRARRISSRVSELFYTKIFPKNIIQVQFIKILQVDLDAPQMHNTVLFLAKYYGTRSVFCLFSFFTSRRSYHNMHQVPVFRKTIPDLEFHGNIVPISTLLTHLDAKCFHLIWLPTKVSTDISTIDLGFVTTATGALNFAVSFLDVNCVSIRRLSDDNQTEMNLH